MSTEIWNNMHFLRPLWLLSLLPLAIICVLYHKYKTHNSTWAQIISPHLIQYLIKDKHKTNKYKPTMFLLSAWLIAVIALAGPSWRLLPQPVEQKTDALLIVLDLSLSMNAQDMKPSRIIRARHKIQDILSQRKEGLTALVVFAGDAHIVVPLTQDSGTIKALLPSLSTWIMPVLGSNPIAGLESALKLLKNQRLKKSRILLITDGIDSHHISNIQAMMQDNPISFSILAIGTDSGAPIPLPNGSFLKKKNGDTVIPGLNITAIEQLASNTGARLSVLTPDDSDINFLLPKHISIQQHAKTLEQKFDTWQDEGIWFVLLLIPGCMLLFRKGAIFTLFFTFSIITTSPNQALAGLWQDLWKNKNQQGYQYFSENQFKKAQEYFEENNWKASAAYKEGNFKQAEQEYRQDTSSTGLYNLGNALAKQNRYNEAIDAYNKALELNPKHQDANYNKKILEDLLRQQKQNSRSQEKNKKSEKQRQQQDQASETEQKSKIGQQSQEKTNRSESSTEETSLSNEQKKSPEEQINPVENQKKSLSMQQSDTQQNEEDKQALQQWLKRIPDDPGGLLRRKFLLESRRNGQKTQPGRSSW